MRGETGAADSGDGGAAEAWDVRHLATHRPTVDDGAAAIALWRTMTFIRRFEEEVYRLFHAGEVFGSTHLCNGQEAVATGVCSVLTELDRIAITYRGHAATIALGVDPAAFLGELMGRESGLVRGRSGSMNVISLRHGLLGCFGIVGGSIAAATGAAFALKSKGSKGVAVAFFGDGAVNQAYFMECLNLSAQQRLPILFVCENNQYGEFTPTAAVTAGGIRPRVQALNIPAVEVDGQDATAVRLLASQLVAEIRAGGGPRFVEAQTYRYVDHARGDPVNYRPDGEMARWKLRDPLLIGRKQLSEQFGYSDESLKTIDAEIAAAVARIVAQVRADPFPQDMGEASEFSPSAAHA